MAKEITSAINFLDMLSNLDVATIAFRKRTNNEMRIMKCTLNFDKIPKSKQPKGVNLKKILSYIQKNNILHVFDVEKMGWRSVPLDNVQWVTDDKDQMYKVKIK